jgi:UDP-N-acetylmuramyl pentapeptide phosphotransferase/UDP-N-acetylglucosamine-1-phosphate transferase
MSFDPSLGILTGWLPAVTALAASAIGTRVVLSWLERRQILDHPNERSSHSRPTPRGGGLAVTPAVLAAWLVAAVLGASLGGWVWGAVAAAGVLLAASWLDDRFTLPAGPRFLAHALAVTALLALLPEGALVFQGWLPPWADRVVTALGWLWFVNLYNFMDGIDGITGIETASLGVGIALVAALSGVPSALAPLGLACAAAGLGFLVWNWHPARIFLGDSGSVPLGLLLGGLLVQLAVAGQLAAALILPAYYLADATITLGKRAARGEKVWQAHRQHFYQRAVQGGKRHDQVVKAIAAGNLLLVGCAVLATMGQVVLGLAVAVVVVAGLLALLQAWSRGGGKRA